MSDRKLKNVPTSEEGWQKVLTQEQYAVLRMKGSEPAFTGALLHETKVGSYRCAACGNPLLLSTSKFDSGTGWPSFDAALPDAVKYIPDYRSGMERTEVVCSRCGSHLGHIFDDGPTKTGKRYCLNSISLELDEK